MRALALSTTAAAAMLLWSASGVQAHAIVPSPTSRPDFCGWYGGDRLIRCWCDEWLRYPICKRWHWHRGGPAWEERF